MWDSCLCKLMSGCSCIVRLHILYTKMQCYSPAIVAKSWLGLHLEFVFSPMGFKILKLVILKMLAVLWLGLRLYIIHTFWPGRSDAHLRIKLFLSAGSWWDKDLPGWGADYCQSSKPQVWHNYKKWPTQVSWLYNTHNSVGTILLRYLSYGLINLVLHVVAFNCLVLSLEHYNVFNRYLVECRYSKDGSAQQSLASVGYMVKTPSSSMPSSVLSTGLYAVQLRIAKGWVLC